MPLTHGVAGTSVEAGSTTNCHLEGLLMGKVGHLPVVAGLKHPEGIYIEPSGKFVATKIHIARIGVVHYIYQPPVKNADTWPFDAEQYLIMNLAILPTIDPSFTESALEVDYIRVYQKSPLVTGVAKTMSAVPAFPNPVNDHLNVQLNKAVHGPVTFEVYNMLGSLMHTEVVNVDHGTAQLRNLDALPKGVYIIASANAGVSETVKFVK